MLTFLSQRGKIWILIERISMKIKVTADKLWNSGQIEVATQAAQWGIDFFHLKKGTIILDMLDSIPDGAEAYCIREKKKKFRIEVNGSAVQPENLSYLKKVIFHEMVHVKQFLVQGLYFGKKHAKFQGQKFKLKSSSDYWLAPWEMEARALEDAMVALMEMGSNEKYSS